MGDLQMLIITEVAPYANGPAGVHGVLGQASTALSELAGLHSLTARVATDTRELSLERLVATDVLALFTIGETRFSEAQKDAIEEQWRSGRTRLLGIHSATDSCYSWDGYGEMLGARFDGHPWTQSFSIDVVDHDHPATQALDDPWPWADEVYLFRSLRPDARVLLRAAEGDLDMTADGARRPEHGFPLAWSIEDGAARTFYSALGHFPTAWENPTYLRYLDGALRWLLGQTAPD